MLGSGAMLRVGLCSIYGDSWRLNCVRLLAMGKTTSEWSGARRDRSIMAAPAFCGLGHGTRAGWAKAPVLMPASQTKTERHSASQLIHAAFRTPTPITFLHFGQMNMYSALMASSCRQWISVSFFSQCGQSGS